MSDRFSVYIERGQISALYPGGGSLVEVTCRSIQGRLLLRPGHFLNEIIIGALARSKRLYGVRLISFSFVSNHFHLLVQVDDAHQLARFMCHFSSKLAREVGRLTGWREKIFGRRWINRSRRYAQC